MSTGQRIVAFFLLSYAFTWFGHLGNWLWPSGAWPLPMFPFGPLIAVILVLWLSVGRDGLRRWGRRVLRFRAPARIYATALLAPAAIIVVSIGLAGFIIEPARSPVWSELPMLLLAAPLIALLGGPATEEPSFRGFGQHELQQTMTPLAAALWIGAGVLIWHLPVLLLGNITWPIGVTLFAVSVVYAWLYQAGGSVWPLVALHLVQNVLGGEFLGPTFAPEDRWVWTGFLMLFYVTWATAIVWRLGPTLGHPVRSA